MTNREFLTYLENLRDKQKEKYKSMPYDYQRAKEKGIYLGLERACFQFECEIIKRERGW